MKSAVLTAATLLALCFIPMCGFAYAQAGASPKTFYQMTTMAPAEYSGGNLDKAESIANWLLKEAPNWEKDWNYGNAVQAANIVLGRIALRRGDLDDAKNYLLAAGKTPGSPQLDSFGPDMTLAKDLLAKGENEIVLKYFDLCAKFWKPQFSRLDEWRSDVKEGRVPEFGPNLRYLGF